MPLQLDRHVPSPGVPEFNRRFGWLIGVVAAAFLILVGRLWQLQVIRGEKYFQQSTNNFKAEQAIPAVRGRIVDRKGNVLVDNRPSFNLYVIPKYFTTASRAALAKLLNLSDPQVEDLQTKLGKAHDRTHEVLILEDIDRDKLALVAQSSTDLPGVVVRDVPHRQYLFGTLAAHVLGYMNQISDPELEARHDEGYEEGDYIGRYGIEKQWENYLRGKRGVEHFVVDAKGNRKTDKDALELIDGPRFVPPVPGHDVVLTIDADLQRIAERALRDHPAAGLAVVEVATGRILALVSKASFDPNVMTGHLTHAEDVQMNADPYKPYLDKTLTEHYYPGSTYKFVTAIAALEDNAINPADKVMCTGEYMLGKRVFHCDKEHGPVDLTEAIAQSCDVYFWHVAEKIGMDKISTVAADFGFGEPTGLGLNGDAAGHIPWKSSYEARGGFRIGYALNTAIGQGDTEVTVLQLALAYAALANGGNLWVPQIVERVDTAAGQTVAAYPPALRRHVKASARSIELVAKGFWGVVNDKKGTAYAARADGVSVAGKTGTAQVGKLVRNQSEKGYDPERDHAWFAGYAPADDPKIAIVVLIEHGGHGGHVAAPVAMEVIRGYFGASDGKLAPAGVSDEESSAPTLEDMPPPEGAAASSEAHP